MDNTGWIKLHRDILNNPIVCKDSDYFSVWSYLLLNATHKEHDTIFGKERITLRRGQLITGRKKIAEKFNISETKVQRILKTFESEHQIEQQTSNKNRLISIVAWDKYQSSEHQIEQQVNNKRTTSEQQVNTYKNDKNINNAKNDKKEIPRHTLLFPTPLHEDISNLVSETAYKSWFVDTEIIETETDIIIKAESFKKGIIETQYKNKLGLMLQKNIKVEGV